MIKIPKEMIIQKIKDKAHLSDEQIKRKVKDKLDQLSGLISEEGALHIIANELGVKIFDESGKVQIKNVIPGMRNVELTGKVVKKYEVRSFDSNNRKGTVGSFLVGDETGVIRIVAWNEKTELMNRMDEGSVLQIKNGYARDNQGRLEIHLGDKTEVSFLKNANIEVKPKTNVRKQIKDLGENEDNVEIMGTIVQIFDPRFFEVCGQCGKRLKTKEDGMYCDEHAKVEPSYSYVSNVFLDDGTDNVRVVLWKNQVQNLFGMANEEIIAKKDTGFEDKKNDLLGQIVKFVGRTNKNDRYERVEFIPQLVFTNPDPAEELKRLDNAPKVEVPEIEAQPKMPIPVEKKAEKPKEDLVVKESSDIEEFELEDLDNL